MILQQEHKAPAYKYNKARHEWKLMEASQSGPRALAMSFLRSLAKYLHDTESMRGSPKLDEQIASSL